MGQMEVFFTQAQRNDLVEQQMAAWYASDEYKNMVAQQLAERDALHPTAIQGVGHLATGNMLGQL